MNRTNLVTYVAEASGLTKAAAEKAIDATFDAITGVKAQPCENVR